MSAVCGTVKPDAVDPRMDDPCILSRRKVWLTPKAAWKKILSVPYLDTAEPVADRCASLFGDFELNGPTCLPLNDSSAIPYLAADADVGYTQSHEIAAPQFAVDREIEQSEVAFTPLQLEPGSNCPYVSRL